MTIKTAYVYKATVIAVHDGDTFTADLDVGFGWTGRYNVRLAGCNAIELKDPGGYEARGHLLELLPVGSVCQITSTGWDKYGGRIDADVQGAGETFIGPWMVKDGYAAAWDGTGPRPTPPWPIPTPAGA